MDDTDYRWFVVASYPNRRIGGRTWDALCIESGWEYMDDAHVQKFELEDEVPGSIHAYARRTLKAKGLDPSDERDWCAGWPPRRA